MTHATGKTLDSEIVLDSNVVMHWLLHNPDYHACAQRLIEDCLVDDVALFAPPTFHAEADSIIRIAVHLNRLSVQDGQALYAQLDALAITTVMNVAIRRRARAIARQLDQPRVYDATYAALAEARDCDFWTGDKRFYNVAHHDFPFVRFIRDY